MVKPNHQSTPFEKAASNFDQIKVEGDSRFRKIAQILRTAIAESVEELRAGATAVSPTTHEFRDAVTQRIKETSQETLQEAREVWANRAGEGSLQEWLRAEIKAISNAMKTTLSKATDSTQIVNKGADSSERYLD